MNWSKKFLSKLRQRVFSIKKIQNAPLLEIFRKNSRNFVMNADAGLNLFLIPVFSETHVPDFFFLIFPLLATPKTR